MFWRNIIFRSQILREINVRTTNHCCTSCTEEIQSKTRTYNVDLFVSQVRIYYFLRDMLRKHAQLISRRVRSRRGGEGAADFRRPAKMQIAHARERTDVFGDIRRLAFVFCNFARQFKRLMLPQRMGG